MRRKIAFTLTAALIGLGLAGTGSARAQPDVAIVTVLVDNAKVMRLPGRTQTVIVGNPIIADVTVRPGGLLVVTGKAYGVTNLIALDASGAVLSERNIEVTGARDDVVVVYRGTNRESYSCVPDCQPRIILGDSPQHFSEALNQSGNRTSQAVSQAALGAITSR